MVDPADPYGFPDSGLQGLDDRVAIVTGSTRGIGRGIAHRLAAEGVRTIVSGRSEDDGAAVVDEIEDHGFEATYVKADLAEPDAATALVEDTVEIYDGVDFLINNAAAWRHGSVLDRSVEDWEAVMAVSLRAPWLLSKAAVEHMDDGGRIINISSVHSVATDPARFPYNVAKSGLNGLTRTLAIDLGPEGVTVNGIKVGAVPQEYRDVNPFDGDSWYARLAPVGRSGTPLDVAALVMFLCSAEAGFITAANIPCDGGRLATFPNANWPADDDTPADASHTYHRE